MDRPYRRPRKATVQLTSLLDLLFVMIFVSLIQQKKIPAQEAKKPVKAKPTPTVQKESKEKKAEKPKEVQPEKPKKKVYTMSAVFKFYPTPGNQDIPKGSYMMQGSFNTDTGKLELGGFRWVNRPANYDMVPLSGKINDQRTLFKGRIEFQGCKEFTLSREEKGQGTPVSGKWVGVYECSQGPTGLTLTLK